ncbi:MAG: DUF1349 domain-containing protein [Trueperaceae bacterium]|nr:DUF1349 domain-containing protein [Trueperaceae bacterium]
MQPRDLTLPAVPSAMTWEVPPAAFEVLGDDAFAVTAPPKSDLFHSPEGERAIATSPRATFPVTAPCLLSARVQVRFWDAFDAGALLVYQGKRSWAKLCLERAPTFPTVVSVVTRGSSDDANAWRVEGDAVWLRVAVRTREIAFHASTDGVRWDLVRHFALEAGAETRIGVSCQSPVGEGCETQFSGVRFREALLDDIRSGA